MGNYWIPVLVIAVIVILNIALWSSLGGKKNTKNTDQWMKINRSIQKPFEKEDHALQELSERVSLLKQKPNNAIESDRNDQSNPQS
jgi:hypothetical protein